MIGTVVVPLDGSELAERALKYGRAIAERSEAPLLLVRVVQQDAGESEVDESRNYLRQVSRSVQGRVQLDVLHGRPSEAIVDTAEQAGDPIIVMSTHGRGGFRKLVTGSVADEIVRTSGAPVLLVRAEMELPETLDLRSIMVPLDGSSYGEVAIEYAVTLAKVFGSRIDLVRVVDTPSAYAMLSRHLETAATGDILDDIIQSMTREANDYLAQVKERIAARGVEVKTTTLEGYPGEQLIAHERQGYFQLVVMATAGRSGVSRVVFGSVAERMLKLGRCPVMMIRPEAQHGSSGTP